MGRGFRRALFQLLELKGCSRGLRADRGSCGALWLSIVLHGGEALTLGFPAFGLRDGIVCRVHDVKNR
jgi:hypothetical protein